MKIPLNKPRYNLEHEEMTKEDWDYYFRCREENDVEFSEQELKKLVKEAVKIVQEKGPDCLEAFFIGNKYPLPASVAKAHKDIYGFKSVQQFNLSRAKKEFPNDF